MVLNIRHSSSDFRARIFKFKPWNSSFRIQIFKWTKCKGNFDFIPGVLDQKQNCVDIVHIRPSPCNALQNTMNQIKLAHFENLFTRFDSIHFFLIRFFVFLNKCVNSIFIRRHLSHMNKKRTNDRDTYSFNFSWFFICCFSLFMAMPAASHLSRISFFSLVVTNYKFTDRLCVSVATFPGTGHHSWEQRRSNPRAVMDNDKKRQRDK